MLRVRFALTLAALLVAAAPAAAQPAEGSVIRKEGEYGGVTPGEAPEKGAKPARVAKKSLNWLGFTPAEDGSAELFFQAVDPFTVSQRMEGATLVVLLEGLKKQARNTRRPLDARFFDTSVARVTAKVVRAKRAKRGSAGHPAGVEVRVTFKDKKDAREGTVRTEKGADGMFYAYLSFPPPATPGQIPDAVDRPQ
ncbi:MAG: hypothetical protein F9K40_18915 [Kofleriaceae bacterium]|nr:MAG: hypothetical protein F9K40_18915 [Kofleriaceae bacterium]MBZ0234333.1 hypothetical protein [Kofleriaceae bacterium]